eukprot:GHVL01036370.1.p1 GENE.GHVL01036370.1~~GHVL01036370.1.p1  ORF type:complete len:210 (+),score=57.66 GHVL01036370.1:27-656(+)
MQWLQKVEWNQIKDLLFDDDEEAKNRSSDDDNGAPPLDSRLGERPKISSSAGNTIETPPPVDRLDESDEDLTNDKFFEPTFDWKEVKEEIEKIMGIGESPDNFIPFWKKKTIERSEVYWKTVSDVIEDIKNIVYDDNMEEFNILSSKSNRTSVGLLLASDHLNNILIFVLRVLLSYKSNSETENQQLHEEMRKMSSKRVTLDNDKPIER